MTRLHQYLNIALQTPGIFGNAGLPLFIWGPPGGGKTSIINEVCKHLDLPCEPVLLVLREPTEVTGLPLITQDGVVIESPSWSKRLSAAGKGVLFFDEFASAPTSVQAAALRIITERVVGDTQLPPGVRIVAASNDVDQSAGGFYLPPPVANRFVHTEWKGVSVQDWTAWMLGSDDADSKKLPTLNLDRWHEAFALYKGIVCAFLENRPALLGPNVPENPVLAGKAWISPRTWEMVVRLLAAMTATGTMDRCYDMAIGTIGNGPAAELLAYTRNVDLPRPRDLLTGTQRFELNPERLDRTLAVLAAIATYTVQYPDYVQAAWTLIGEYTRGSADLAVTPARTLINANLYSSSAAVEVLAGLSDMLIQANVHA